MNRNRLLGEEINITSTLEEKTNFYQFTQKQFIVWTSQKM